MCNVLCRVNLVACCTRRTLDSEYKHFLRLEDRIVMHAQYTIIYDTETKEPAAQGARNKGTVCAKAHGPNDNDYITNNYTRK